MKIHSISNEYSDLLEGDIFALKDHTHSEYATTAALNNKFDKSNIVYGSTDLVPGTSVLATGSYYFKYD